MYKLEAFGSNVNKLPIYLKTPYIFVFMQKQYPETFLFLIQTILELFTRKVCKMFVYKHTETIE